MGNLCGCTLHSILRKEYPHNEFILHHNTKCGRLHIFQCVNFSNDIDNIYFPFEKHFQFISHNFFSFGK